MHGFWLMAQQTMDWHWRHRELKHLRLVDLIVLLRVYFHFVTAYHTVILIVILSLHL